MLFKENVFFSQCRYYYKKYRLQLVHIIPVYKKPHFLHLFTNILLDIRKAIAVILSIISAYTFYVVFCFFVIFNFIIIFCTNRIIQIILCFFIVKQLSCAYTHYTALLNNFVWLCTNNKPSIKLST